MLVTWPCWLQVSPVQEQGSVEGLHEPREVPEGSRVAFRSSRADVCAKLSDPAVRNSLVSWERLTARLSRTKDSNAFCMHLLRCMEIARYLDVTLGCCNLLQKLLRTAQKLASNVHEHVGVGCIREALHGLMHCIL